MDRSKLSATFEGITFVRDVDGCAGADVVIIDYMRSGRTVSEVRTAVPNARIVAFGRHTDETGAAAAKAAGADLVWPRSRFFRDPAAALEGLIGGPI